MIRRLIDWFKSWFRRPTIKQVEVPYTFNFSGGTGHGAHFNQKCRKHQCRRRSRQIGFKAVPHGGKN
jgi:hypothetical protein